MLMTMTTAMGFAVERSSSARIRVVVGIVIIVAIQFDCHF